MSSLVLLICLMLPVIITAAVYAMRKYQIKKEVKHKLMQDIHREDLVHLKFTKAQLETELDWEHSREFEYRDEMYDVVYCEQIGDTTHLWCWWDHEETALNKTVRDAVANAIQDYPAQKQDSERLAQFFKSLFVHTNQPLGLILQAPLLTSPWHYPIGCALDGYTKGVDDPPDFGFGS